jgi:methionine-rich copper-binding protein CopC
VIPALAPTRRALLAAALLLLPLTAATPLAALPHMRLLRSTPAANAMLTASPDAIRLWFSEPVDPKGSTVTVKGAGGAAVALAPLTPDAAKDAPLVATLAKPVPAGAYTVTWKGMSRDGHVVNGTFTFHVHGAP